MKILFLNHSAKLGGAELSLIDVSIPYRDSGLVLLAEDGPFRYRLEEHHIPVQVLAAKPLGVRRNSGFFHSLKSINQLLPLSLNVAQIARDYDILYANNQKSLVVGALASFFGHRPLVYHLRDILSREHFSQSNLNLIITLANRFAMQVVANSQATQSAFIQAGGRADLIDVVYNGFQPERYQGLESAAFNVQQELKLTDRFVIGHFSRLSPWKGQHILIESLQYCSENVVVLLVGEALFGEQDYVDQLHQQVTDFGLQERVQFLGFRSDIPAIMTACDLVAHTSTAPEPFGRVIVEAMMCGSPIVAANAGGAVELISHDQTGWLTPPRDPMQLAEVINYCQSQPEQAEKIAHWAQQEASRRFHLSCTNQQLAELLQTSYQRKLKSSACLHPG